MRVSIKAALVCVTLGVTPSVAASTDGSLGETSNGEVTLVAEITEPSDAKISITNLEDISFSKKVGEPAKEKQSISACVYMDKPELYDLYIEADPLIDGQQAYPCRLEAFQAGSPGGTIDLSVKNLMLTGEANRLRPSTVEGCVGSHVLTLRFTDQGAETVTSAFSATSTVRLTVSPE